MFVGLELTPWKRNAEKTLTVVDRVSRLVEAVNLIHTSFRQPRMPSFILATVLRQRLRVEPIAHYKTVNMNAVRLKSVLYGCAAVGVEAPGFRIGVGAAIGLLKGLMRFFDGLMISSSGNHEREIKPWRLS